MIIKELTSHEAINIQASPKLVWKILTELKYMEKWSELKINFANENKLHKGSEIHWIDDNNEAYAVGIVTDFEPERKLRVAPQFTSWKQLVPPKDIASTFVLYESDNGTYLEFSYGDFAKVPEGEKLWKMYLKSITPKNKELEKIKKLAEDENQ